MGFMLQEDKKRMRWLFVILLLAGVFCVLSSCGEKKKTNGPVVQVYYVSNMETKIETHEYEKPVGSTEEQVKTLMAYLAAVYEKPPYKSPLAMGFQVLGVEYQEGGLILNMDENYSKLNSTTEVLVRAAIVRTLIQADGVNRVEILVNGSQLTDGAGDPVGWMTDGQFIYNDGSEINSYEQIRVKLYFANEAGDKLIAAYREKFYSTNISLERFVVDEILAGPSGKIAGLYATISPDTKILSVMTKDGICYLNFDSNFLTVVNNVNLNVEIYSIVNSLTELQGVNRVQILVDGDVPDVFGSAMFERNMDIVTTLE